MADEAVIVSDPDDLTTPSNKVESVRQSRCNLVLFMILMSAGAMGNGYATPSAN